jgi:phosphoglucosamine mutase
VAARRYFGTDGVRGVVGEDVTPELVGRLGAAFARWSGGARVLVGRDTRASGPELERALAAGLAAGGSAVRLGGVLPTPAVALLADGAGAVITASHNPPEYNGVKFFRDGLKLDDEDEQAIEAALEDAPPPPGPPEHPRAADLAERYVELVTRRFGTRLEGLRVAVDCANGAMYEVAPNAFERLGATVMAVGNEPDGSNINRGCGATDLSLLSRVAREQGVDLGVAFDGDGDRMLAVDAAGREVDGDQIVAVLALHLGVDLVAVTQMTNLGFHRLMADRGVRVVTTDVGDRYVLEALRAEGGLLGGEQSGHVVYDGIGDGLAAALLLCRAVVEEERPLAELAAAMPVFPQVKANLRVSRKEIPAALRAEIDRAAAVLGDSGRVLVRPSGTEPVIRILAEAESEEAATRLCGTIEHLVSRELGESPGSPP